MKIIELTAQNILDGFKDVISNRKQCFVYGIPDNNYVFPGTNNIIDEDFCKSKGVKLLPIPNQGGVIVLSKGDVEIGIFQDNGWDVWKNYLNLLCEKLKEKVPNIEVVGNDLVIDGKYKCVGSSSRNLGDAKNPYIYTAVHISINMDLELIKNICKKEMVKIPKGLSEYGITTDEIVKLIIDLANKIN
jgi:hypothetical protein